MYDEKQTNPRDAAERVHIRFHRPIVFDITSAGAADRVGRIFLLRGACFGRAIRSHASQWEWQMKTLELYIMADLMNYGECVMGEIIEKLNRVYKYIYDNCGNARPSTGAGIASFEAYHEALLIVRQAMERV